MVVPFLGGLVMPLRWLVLTPLVILVFATVPLVIMGLQPRTAYRWALAFPLLALLMCLVFPVSGTSSGNSKVGICGSVVFPNKGYAGGDHIGIGCRSARFEVVVLAMTVCIAGMLLSLSVARGALKTRDVAEDTDVPRARGWSSGDGGGSGPE